MESTTEAIREEALKQQKVEELGKYNGDYYYHARSMASDCEPCKKTFFFFEPQRLEETRG